LKVFGEFNVTQMLVPGFTTIPLKGVLAPPYPLAPIGPVEMAATE